VRSHLFDGLGEVVELRDRDRAGVKAGNLFFVVPLKSLTPITEKPAKKEKVPDPELRFQGKQPSLSVNLHGMRVDEALEAVDKALNDAVLNNSSVVVVVHGKGTGTLRREVRKFLSSNPLVSSFREGTPSEGGPGVTVVYLKG
jgi:DNA mismatch repair protein MutS2